MHAEFEAWAEASGVKLFKVEASAVAEGGRGVVASMDIAPGEILVSIPRALLMTEQSALRDPALARVLAPPASFSPQQALIMHLLCEMTKAEESAWWPYLRQVRSPCLARSRPALRALLRRYAPARPPSWEPLPAAAPPCSRR